MRSDMNNAECFKMLEDMGKLEYGSTISLNLLYDIFGIEKVEYPATRAEMKRLELEELKVTGYIRDKLLNQGKYLKGEKDSYRVLLPSENAGQIISYMESADRKLKRALKLNRNTPPDYKISSNDEVRLFMKSGKQ